MRTRRSSGDELRPRHCRLAVRGRPARGDLPASELPELGSSAISVRALVGPSPGTEASKSSLSRQLAAAHGVVDILIDAGQLLLQRLQAGDAFAQMGSPFASRAGAQPRSSRCLPSASEAICEQPGLLIGTGGSPSSRLGETGDDRSIDRSVLRAVLAPCEDRICAVLPPLESSAATAAATVSPPVASNATLRRDFPQSVARRSNPAASRSTTNASPLRQTATSRRSFYTSIPTVIMSMATLPCPILRTRSPARGVAGFSGEVRVALVRRHSPSEGRASFRTPIAIFSPRGGRRNSVKSAQ